MYPNAFESIFAHGLLAVGHPPSVMPDGAELDIHTNKDGIVNNTGILLSQSIAGKPLTNGPSPLKQDAASNGHINTKNASPVGDSDKQTTQLNQHLMLIRLPNALLHPMPEQRWRPRQSGIPMQCSHYPRASPELIPRASSESRGNWSSSKSDSSKADKMVVDNDVSNATQESSSRPRARSITSEPVGLLMAQDNACQIPSYYTPSARLSLNSCARKTLPPTLAQSSTEAGMSTIMNSANKAANPRRRRKPYS